MKVNIKAVKERVTELLTKDKETRDNDDRLIALIWFNEAQSLGLNMKYDNARDFLRLFAQGKLTNPESIRRSRQKIQELNPHLRGEKYHKRRKNIVDVQNQVRNFNQ